MFHFFCSKLYFQKTQTRQKYFNKNYKLFNTLISNRIGNKVKFSFIQKTTSMVVIFLFFEIKIKRNKTLKAKSKKKKTFGH